MTYRQYIQNNKIKDSKEAWEQYNEQYNTLYKHMNPAMKKQHIEVTFKTRFSIQF